MSRTTIEVANEAVSWTLAPEEVAHMTIDNDGNKLMVILKNNQTPLVFLCTDGSLKKIYNDIRRHM